MSKLLIDLLFWIIVLIISVLAQLLPALIAQI